MARDRLTLKQQMFIEHYLANGGNATVAARQAGYSGSEIVLTGVGSRLLANVSISTEIARRVEQNKNAIGADEVIAILTAQARGVGAAAGGKTLADIGLNGVARVVVRRSRKQIEEYNPQAAAIQLGKYHGLWREDLMSSAYLQTLITDTVRAVSETLNEHVGDSELRERIKARLAERLESGVS